MESTPAVVDFERVRGESAMDLGELMGHETRRRLSGAESPTVRSYRELLGVGPQATSGDLKKAFHRLALLYHPDRNPGPDAARQFDEVRKAYEILQDPVHVRALNQNFLRERLFNTCIEGLSISFGAFFGYRLFTWGDSTVPRRLRLGAEREGESDLSAWDE